MANSRFPEYVEAFVDAVRNFVGSFGLELHDSRDASHTTAHSRVYELSHGDYKSRLIVHRTSRSMASETGEFRARALMELPRQVESNVAGLENIANRFACLGALTAYEGGASVVSQSLIKQATSEVTAGIMAAALVHAAPSTVLGLSGAAGGSPIETVRHVSAWSDLDFEQIQYDYAHLGIGSLAIRGWSQTYLGGDTLTLDAVDNHPYWGGGLLILLRPVREYFHTDGQAISANELNVLTQLADDVPAFGAWCKRDNEFWFVSFAPNFLKELPGFTDLTIEMADRRLRSTPNLVQAVLATRPGAEARHRYPRDV